MVDVRSLVEDGSLFGVDQKDIKIIETHISIVCLTGGYVYKFKKPVDFGFLDFSTREKRIHYCKEELRLNRRLSPDIYLGLAGVVRDEDGSYRIIDDVEDKNTLIEPAVKMRELPQDALLKERIRHGGIDEDMIDDIIDILVGFYRDARTDETISSYGLPDQFRINLDENFEQTEPFIGTAITKEVYDAIKEKTMSFYDTYAWLFQKRVDGGFIKECHGDLHSGNIFVHEGSIHIFDCIEFNERIKNGDVASDIAFLAMDLAFHGYQALGERLVRGYASKTGDRDLLKLIQFYKSYRAYVRGKITCFMLNDAEGEARERLLDDADRYFNLAKEYAEALTYRPVAFDQPVVILMAGRTASGKSRTARMLAEMLGCDHIQSDALRREMFPESTTASFNEGAYTEDKREAVYDRMMTRAQQIVNEGRSCILDASFISQRQRSKALAIEGTHHILVYVSISDEMARTRLEKRKRSLSDGTWEVYLAQKEHEDALTEDEKEITIMVDGALTNKAESVFDTLVERLKDHIS